jgi:uncharacterized protein with HEPN domain
MQLCCSKVLRYSQGLTRQQFLADEMLVDAVLRNLEVLGEAAKQIPAAVRERHPQLPWLTSWTKWLRLSSEGG